MNLEPGVCLSQLLGQEERYEADSAGEVEAKDPERGRTWVQRVLGGPGSSPSGGLRLSSIKSGSIK